MKYVFIVLVFFFSFDTFSQNVLLEENPINDTLIPKKGPNLRRFSHFYMGYEVIADNFSDQSATVKNAVSNVFFLGYRHKMKINNFWSVGYALNFNSSTYSIKQNEKKIFPDSLKHKRERLIVSGLGVQLFTRFNFDKRGNKIGKYLDVGCYASWDFANSHFIRDNTVAADSSNAKVITVTEQKLKYFENYEYGFKARIGSNHIAISATYRFSDLIKPSYKYPELPKLSIGLEIGIY